MEFSRESRALRRSYAAFTDGADPDTVITVLYTELLLTPKEKERATQSTLTATKQLEVIFECLERRVSTDPSVFHKLVQRLLEEPALEAVGLKMQACYNEEQSQSVQSANNGPSEERERNPPTHSHEATGGSSEERERNPPTHSQETTGGPSEEREIHPLTHKKLKLQWQTQRSAPETFIRGGAVSSPNTIYCMSSGSHTVYQYEVDEDEWKRHSKCPHTRAGLAIIKDMLTAVGGKVEGSGKTNKLVTWRNEQWEEVFCPMTTARSSHDVVCDDRYVIAVGGREGVETSVELFTVSSNIWSTVTSLPQPLHNINATLCRDKIYVMDHERQTFSISVSHWTKRTLGEPSCPHPKWESLPHPTPVVRSSLASLSGEVVAVGGARGGTTATGDIYQLYKGEWVRIGCMDTAREWPIVAVFRGDRMVVVGGYCSSPSPSLTAVEVAFLS